MSETRKLTTILAADVVGYSRLAAADEERTLARLRALRSDLVDPAISIHHGRVVKRTGDGILVEFRSPVEAVRCAIEVQDGVAERNAGLPPERRIEFRIGVHLGDVVEEADGDLMGDAVNIAARIEGIAEPGGIYVSRAAHDQIGGKLTERFTDLGERELKNIPKAVRVFALARTRDLPATSILQSTTSPRLSIVVLPFTNIGGDAEQDYFVDGVTESLTTDLSRISGSFVIGRNTAFTYKGKAVDLKQIGRDLNVRYVLEGSVQRGGNRLRVNVQLIEAETGAHLWAERFDKPVADLFEMQDEIVARLARQLNTELTTAEARRAERAPIPDSTDFTFRGNAVLNRDWNPEGLRQALAFFERAVQLDPNNVEALVGIATGHYRFAAGFLADDSRSHVAACVSAATRALALAPDHARAHDIMGWTNLISNRLEQAAAESEQAMVLDRNLVSAYSTLAMIKIASGRAEEAAEYVVQGLRLSPKDSTAHQWCLMAGAAALYLGRYSEAIAWLRRSVEFNRTWHLSRIYLAAALAQNGEIVEARQEAAKGSELAPGFTVGRFRAQAYTSNATYLAQRENLYEGMRKAGVPEG